MHYTAVEEASTDHHQPLGKARDLSGCIMLRWRWRPARIGTVHADCRLEDWLTDVDDTHADDTLLDMHTRNMAAKMAETVNWLIKQLTHVDAIVHDDDPSFAILLRIGSIIRGEIATVL